MASFDTCFAVLQSCSFLRILRKKKVILRSRVIRSSQKKMTHVFFSICKHSDVHDNIIVLQRARTFFLGFSLGLECMAVRTVQLFYTFVAIGELLCLVSP